jgi:hypothetical protein
VRYPIERRWYSDTEGITAPSKYLKTRRISWPMRI